jgi:hypothetical protein
VLNEVVWGIFWKVFRRLCGPPTRSVGPTDRSVGLLVGWTQLSGTAVSLVGGDPGVPMSHNGSGKLKFYHTQCLGEDHMLTSAFHWALVRLGIGDLVGTAFAGTSLKYYIIEVLLLQVVPRLSMYRLQHVSACHPYRLTSGVNVELPLAQDNYQKNG